MGVLAVLVSKALDTVVELRILAVGAFSVIGKDQRVLLIIFERKALFLLPCCHIRHDHTGAVKGSIVAACLLYQQTACLVFCFAAARYTYYTYHDRTG